MSDGQLPSLSREISRNNMSCSELLHRVQQAESSLPEGSVSFFGHPPQPTLHACQLYDSQDEEDEDAVFLLMARSRRCVCVQLWTCPTRIASDDDSWEELSQPSEVLEILRLEEPAPVGWSDEEPRGDEEEIITCATVLSLDKNFPYTKRDVIPLLTPVTVVVGTNYSRVLSIEFSMESWTTGQRTLRLNNDESLIFEPLPLDRESPIQRQRGIGGDALRNGNDNDQSFSEMSATSEKEDGSRDEENKSDALSGIEESYSFSPQGGVTSLNPFICNNSTTTIEGSTFVWAAYQDGTAVRLHHGGFFSSILADPNVDLGPDALITTRVLLPPFFEAAGATVLPLPKHHPSPFSPLPPMHTTLPERLPLDDHDENESSATDSKTAEEDEVDFVEYVPDIYESVSYGMDTGAAGPADQDDLPVLSFHTSENHYDLQTSGALETGGHISSKDNELFDAIKDNVIGGAKKFVGGVFGGAIGAVKWGLGGGEKNEEVVLKNRPAQGAQDTFIASSSSGVVPFPGMYDTPTDLFSGFEIQDAPRQVTFVAVDPAGNLAAAADNLGRVLLIDLATKQVVRMWKGVREASCCWIEVPRREEEQKSHWPKGCVLYLVIHSKQRRVVEIWRMRHGPKVKSIQVGREAQIVQYRETSKVGCLASCLLLRATSTATTQNKVERLTVTDAATRSGVSESKRRTIAKTNLSKSTHEAALRLQLLQQLLADTNVPANTHAVYEAFSSISSLTDLGSALDLLAVSPQLEKSMGVEGTSFQAIAISYCREKLDGVLKETGEKAYANANVKELLSKITYHEQVVDAYNILSKFEDERHVDDDEDVNLLPRSAWAVEALGWIDTYERVTDTSTKVDESKTDCADRLRFASFATACCASDFEVVFANGIKGCKHHVHFADSSRTRSEILVRLFKPLLQDVFAFKVVNSIFATLAISTDYDYLLKCFGEWFMTLPARQAAQKSFFIWNSPVVRWLQGIVSCQLDEGVPPESLLQALQSFCSESDLLVRAFLLAALCHEAIALAARQKEEKTYGKISYTAAVRPWESLLRRLRVCVFVSLRLHGISLGSFPVTVRNVDEDTFSIFEWVARDELLSSHSQDEVAMLEASCKESGLIFHPSLQEGDDPLLLKRLHKACTSRTPKDPKPGRSGHIVSTRDDKPGALLLFLSDFNKPVFLVAHRALLLSGMWSQEPSSLHVLKDSLSALRALEEESTKFESSLVSAVSVELWQTHIRPVYRAFLFGFHDVPELSEDVISPLFCDTDWLRGLGQMALAILSVVARLEVDNNHEYLYSAAEKAKTSKEEEDMKDKSSQVWPPVRDDFVLKRLVQRTNRVEPSGLDLHRAVICAALLSSGDLSSLAQCFSGFFDSFLQTSLFTSPPAPATATASVEAERDSFLHRAIVTKAQRSTGGLGLSGPVLDNLELGEEIDTLAKVWGVPREKVRTSFLLAMYELGKDEMVDDLIISHVQYLDVDRFVNCGIDVACLRLDWVIADMRGSSERRHALALLDAETCQWIRERTAHAPQSLLEQYADANVSVSTVAVSLTHTFILRLLSLSSASGDKMTRIQIHSLSVLTGTLLRERI